MKDAIRMSILGIKCDNPECNFRDDSVKLEEYNKWLNKPCPKCGDNLLTEADYNMVKLMMGLTNEFASIYPQIEDNSEEVHVEIKMNGTGNIEFGEIINK